MPNVVQNPHQEDLFFGDPHLSDLLPRSVRVSSKSAISANQETESILSFFRSMELNSSSELLEQANKILNSSYELRNFEFSHHLPSKDMDRNSETNAVDCPQKRRPGLGRKRARFSFKPSTSQPFSNVDPSLSSAELQDPEEFFAAFEKHENAEKELKRLRGDVSTDLSQTHQSLATRPRRPGILGKTVNYRHHYPSLSEDVENLVPSQEEKFEERIPRLSKATPNMMSNIEAMDQPATTLEREKDGGEPVPVTQGKGSVAKTVNRVGDLLDGLLSAYKDLDRNEMVTLLQEELQIKPIEVNKLSLPDMSSVQRNYLKAPQEHLSRPRKALNDLQHVMNTMANGNTPVAKQAVESFEGPLISPTPPRNPFASISNHNLQIDPLGDALSELPLISPTPPRNPFASISMLQNHNLQIAPLGDALSEPPAVDISSVEIDGKRLSFDRSIQSPMCEVDNSVDGNINSGKLVTEDSACPFSLPTDENSSRPDGDMDAISNGFKDKLGDKVKDLLQEASTSSASQLLLSGEEIDGNKMSSNGKSESPMCEEDSNINSGKLVTEDSACPFGIPTNCNPIRSYNDMDGRSNEFGESWKDKAQDLAQEASTSMETMDRGQLDESNSAAGTHLPVDGNSDNVTCIPKQHNEDYRVPPISLLTKPSKTREPSHRQNKQKEQCRGSLAGAGTLWKSGVRRSTRIKSRPLEYWRGERFLYGRIHDSLATVIGVKCSSSPPGKRGEEPVLKVKSFVSEEYKELVEQAALY